MIALLSLGLTSTGMFVFTIGALGTAAALGLGKGGRLQTGARLFLERKRTVTGLEGAFGGLGGFFPPPVLGFNRERNQSVHTRVRFSRRYLRLAAQKRRSSPGSSGACILSYRCHQNECSSPRGCFLRFRVLLFSESPTLSARSHCVPSRFRPFRRRLPI